jgi:hypothetical protein
MNGIGSWTFAALVSLLAAGDWAALSLTAEDPAETLPAFAIGDTTVTAVGRDLELDGTQAFRPVLMLGGKGAGSVQVRLQCTRMNPLARMMPVGKTVWSDTIAFDGRASSEVVLSACPLPLRPPSANPEGAEELLRDVDVYSLQVSADGLGWTDVFTMSVPVVKTEIVKVSEEEKP